ncbi:hypothetical protein NsoK4_07830 [Nitrosopumilus sp. K4]|uniref:hypothetical protein n=1 Tax=Nitrosopumilus sp. K4 TaxID=2795383 RepID=UPI001BAD6C83|nr:hypothetical protein [Nitrosopumilus sp. K4]QUC64328.1 hypothetical protein NsoK4_07830 [Nitrosopumilus sp. K4]
MQEIAILLSSLAGVATAAAVRKMPRNKTQLLSIGASSHIKSQIRTLNIEKDILTKTISRLYQADSEYSKIQRDKLLLKYQHQLGIVLAKIEKLEQASQHPDLGPVGDGLITLMDQKLSRLDDRLYELSSKIVSSEISAPEIKLETKQEEKPKPKEENKTNIIKEKFTFDKPKTSDPIVIPPPKQRQSFELTTLTRLSRKEPSFPLFEKQETKQEIVKETIQPKTVIPEVKPKEDIVNEIVQPKPKVEDKIEIIQSVTPKPEVKTEIKPDLAKEVEKITEHKALPEPQKKLKPTSLDDDFDDDDDSDDLDKIKGEIMNVLSKLDQAEVE